MTALMTAVQADPGTWAPAVMNGQTTVPAGGFVVDTSNRMEALSFYNTVFLASEGAENRSGWTGSYTASCTRGTTSPAFREDVRRRVNYYRAVCGLPAAITFEANPAVNDSPAGSPQVAANTSKRTCAQASAYMNAFSNVFFDNYSLSHTPSSGATVCYNTSAWNGSAHSNLSIGYFGPRAIDVYMADDDLSDDLSNNVNVGHRRWILYSRAKDMATGDVPAGSYNDGTTTFPVLPGNALYVTGTFNDVAASPRQFVTWPPRGYLPKPLLPLRWSISWPGATFPASAANITLTGPAGTSIPVTIISANQNTHGDNTLVFAPQSLPLSATGDSAFTVTVTGMSGNGVPASTSWQTIFFDPYSLGVTQSVSGPVQPPRAGADYQFTPAPLAGTYQVLVSQPAAAATYVEAAEGAAPDLSSSKTGSYPVIQPTASLNGLTFTPRGTKSLHLCFPLDSSEVDYLPHEQSFSLGPEFIPAANSILTFSEHFRWLFSVNRLSVELSSDGGNKFVEVYGRNGAFIYNPQASYASSGWDPGWSTRSVSLATWAGQPIRLRFILRPGTISFDGQDINHGCYIDDITLTNVRRIAAGSDTTIGQTVFNLNSTSAGGMLQPGISYLLRVRPQIGTRYMGYSQPLTVVPAPPSGFETAYPALAALPLEDSDQDGICNFLEYALGLNPNARNSSALPAPVPGPTGLTLDFAVPAGITDVNYIAECSTDLKTWLPVTNLGTGTQRSYTAPLTNGAHCFMRVRAAQILP